MLRSRRSLSSMGKVVQLLGRRWYMRQRGSPFAQLKSGQGNSTLQQAPVRWQPPTRRFKLSST